MMIVGRPVIGFLVDRMPIKLGMAIMVLGPLSGSLLGLGEGYRPSLLAITAASLVALLLVTVLGRAFQVKPLSSERE